MAESYNPKSILGRLLNERLIPWLTPDLSRYADAIGKPFQQVLELADETGEEGYATTPVVKNPVYNPSFEYDSVGKVPVGWSTNGVLFDAAAATAVVRSGNAAEGQQYLEITTGGVFAGEGVQSGENVPVTKGVQITFYAYMRGVEGTKINFEAGGEKIGSEASAASLTNSWVQYSTVYTPAANGTVAVAFTTINQEVTTFQVDGISATTTYVDGDTKGYYWTGEIGNSPSRTIKYVPSWGKLLDPSTCPGKYLSYLAMFVGVQIPITATEAEARELVKNESGLERGTQSAIEMAIRRVLGREIPFAVVPRTNPKAEEKGYFFIVIVPPSHSSKALKEAIESVKPGGVMFEIIEREGTWYVGTKKWSEVAAGKKWSAIKEGEYLYEEPPNRWEPWRAP